LKNLKIYLTSLAIFSGLSLCSCSGQDLENLNHSYEDALFFNKYDFSMKEFLRENGVVELEFVGFQPLSYYEAKVSEPYVENGKLYFNDSWRKIDDFNEHFGIARRVDVFYKFVFVDFSGDAPVIKEYITDDVSSVPEEYKYIYKDDYLVYEYSDEIFVNNGKVVKKVR